MREKRSMFANIIVPSWPEARPWVPCASAVAVDGPSGIAPGPLPIPMPVLRAQTVPGPGEDDDEDDENDDAGGGGDEGNIEPDDDEGCDDEDEDDDEEPWQVRAG